MKKKTKVTWHATEAASGVEEEEERRSVGRSAAASLSCLNIFFNIHFRYIYIHICIYTYINIYIY